nr:nucleotidyltransferase family protein [Lentilactobacillus kisonensis]
MLRAVGIVSEYNPFHNGHRYQLQQAKLRTGADVTVAIMSGNWLQRGEPAIFDKWQRAAVALKNGIDIVIELPFFRLFSHLTYLLLERFKLLLGYNVIGYHLVLKILIWTIRS